MTYDFGRSRDAHAVSVVVAKDRYLDLVEQLRPRIPPGWLIFAGTDRWLGDEDHGDGVELVIGPGNDQFDALRLARSDAINYDMMTEDLIRKLKEYDSQVGLTILQATQTPSLPNSSPFQQTSMRSLPTSMTSAPTLLTRAWAL